MALMHLLNKVSALYALSMIRATEYDMREWLFRPNRLREMNKGNMRNTIDILYLTPVFNLKWGEKAYSCYISRSGGVWSEWLANRVWLDSGEDCGGMVLGVSWGGWVDLDAGRGVSNKSECGGGIEGLVWIVNGVVMSSLPSMDLAGVVGHGVGGWDGVGGVSEDVGGETWGMSSNIDLRLGGWYAGMNFLRCLSAQSIYSY